jgi:hypothetical protein
VNGPPGTTQDRPRPAGGLTRRGRATRAKGILSRTLFNDDRLKGVLCGFAQGEERSDYTASMPAVLHLLPGKATVMLGDDRHEAVARGRPSPVRLRSDSWRQLNGS